MPSQSAIMTENYFSTVAFTGHTLTADEEATGHEAFRIATGRRSIYTNYYESTTANTQRTLTLACDRIREANGFVLYPGHNLAGEQVVLEASEDSFATVQTCFDIVLPSAMAPGSLDDSFGVRTEEGAWLKRFTARAGSSFRLRIPAMGAGLKPKIVGAQLGNWYLFDPIRPWAPDRATLVGEESMADGGWRGAGSIGLVREGVIKIKLTTQTEYELARLHLGYGSHFARRRPAWYVPDEGAAETAFCITAPFGQSGFAREPQWYAEQADIPYVEHEGSAV